ncbi:hypothetical protein HJG60_011252 [Phyllostomus discolor]|uniref:Uncharacterized protein n=1 Tax=Phyllostomus discolor TaxID=89673 RepID=A0A833ZWG2_9CHIR|nr:hypothetical protein HJG60_011252 [Phyllostomus discolor]
MGLRPKYVDFSELLHGHGNTGTWAPSGRGFRGVHIEGQGTPFGAKWIPHTCRALPSSVCGPHFTGTKPSACLFPGTSLCLFDTSASWRSGPFLFSSLFLSFSSLPLPSFLNVLFLEPCFSF